MEWLSSESTSYWSGMTVDWFDNGKIWQAIPAKWSQRDLANLTVSQPPQDWCWTVQRSDTGMGIQLRCPDWVAADRILKRYNIYQNDIFYQSLADQTTWQNAHCRTEARFCSGSTKCSDTRRRRRLGTRPTLQETVVAATSLLRRFTIIPIHDAFGRSLSVPLYAGVMHSALDISPVDISVDISRWMSGMTYHCL